MREALGLAAARAGRPRLTRRPGSAAAACYNSRPETCPACAARPSRRRLATGSRTCSRRPDHEVDLAEAALLIAAQEYESLDVRAYLVRLDEMGAALRNRLDDEQRPERAVMALNHYLFQELGFRGNTDSTTTPATAT